MRLTTAASSGAVSTACGNERSQCYKKLPLPGRCENFLCDEMAAGWHKVRTGSVATGSSPRCSTALSYLRKRKLCDALNSVATAPGSDFVWPLYNVILVRFAFLQSPPRSQWLRRSDRTTKRRQVDLVELSGRTKDCRSLRQAANNTIQDPGSHYKTRRADCFSRYTRSTPARL